MKHFILALLFITLPLSFTYAQETSKTREIGLTTSDLNSFGVTYRKGNESSVWRFNALSSSLSFNNDERDDLDSDLSTFGFGLSIGKEWRSPVKDKLELRYGFDLRYSYSHGKTESFNTNLNSTVENISNSFETGINGVFGFNFLFTNEFLLGGEFLPTLYYGSSKLEIDDPQGQSSTRNTDSFGFRMNTSSVRLSLLYRF